MKETQANWNLEEVMEGEDPFVFSQTPRVWNGVVCPGKDGLFQASTSFCTDLSESLWQTSLLSLARLRTPAHLCYRVMLRRFLCVAKHPSLSSLLESPRNLVIFQDAVESGS